MASWVLNNDCSTQSCLDSIIGAVFLRLCGIYELQPQRNATEKDTVLAWQFLGPMGAETSSQGRSIVFVPVK